MTAKSVAVLGAGSWGSALAHVLAENGHDVRLWTRNEALAHRIRTNGSNEQYLPGASLNKNIQPSTDMVDTITGTQFVVSACPSHAVREVLETARPYLDKQTLISTSKGIEITSDLRMSEVIAEVLDHTDDIQTVALSGPSFAEELVRGLPTAVVAASLNEDAAKLVQGLFQNGYLRIYTQPDVSGVELGGALKNVIALAAGVSDGIFLGNNARAAIITRGLAEIVRLASRLGAQESTLAGLAGLGDLVLTCTSDMSRNRTVGIAIGSGRDPDEVMNNMDQAVEGVRTAHAAHELGHKLDVELPITQGIYSILYENVAPREALARLMAREPKPERWGN
jgi:glycerol-3-phosphate dehydrogenase (NAD(P)+)